MTTARLAPSAKRDLLLAMNWIANDNPAAARALRRNVQRASVTIGELRHIGALRLEIVPALIGVCS